MNYLFILGRDPELARAELETYLETRGIPFKEIDSGKEAIVLDLKKFDKKILKDLGGTIKVAEVLSSEKRIDRIEYSLKSKELYQGTSNKLTYSVTGYQTDLDSFLEDYLKDYFKEIKVKAQLRKEQSPSKLARKEEFLDFIVFKSHIAITIAVSNPQELKKRDLERPAVDHMKVISLRLAKILINLSGAKEDSLFIDPFCGSGTILQEALLLGCRVVGFDKDVESIKQSKQNLEWLKKNYPLKYDYKLHIIDARKIAQFLPVRSVDSVATEPFMGPFIRKLPTIFQAQQQIQELSPLYASVLNQLSQVIKPGKKVVFVVPRFKTTEGKTVSMHFDEIAKDTTFDVEYKFFYAYKESKLLRDIYVLRKN